MPVGGKIHLFSAYDPSYWMNQKPGKMVKRVFYNDPVGGIQLQSDKGLVLNTTKITEFKSTNDIYLLTEPPATCTSTSDPSECEFKF
jgi:hypothetical protein